MNKTLHYNIGITKTESINISVIRVLAMFLIVGCHLCYSFERLAFIGQVLNVGVDVFFIISGFIYGQKKIKNVRQWIRTRFIRIIIPTYAFYLIMSMVLLSIGKLGELNVRHIVLQLLNLQGFIDGADIGNLYLVHLWFISFILVCYLLTPLLQKIRGYINLGGISLILVILSVLEISIITRINIQSFMVCIPGIFVYIFAYFLGAYWNKKISIKNYLLITFIMLVGIALRLYVLRMANVNDTYEIIYSRVIAQYTHIFLAYWIFFTVYAICEKNNEYILKFIRKIKFLDNISFEVYITHQVFCAGVLSVFNYTNNLILNLFLFTVITLISSILLNKISNFFISLLRR